MELKQQSSEWNSKSYSAPPPSQKKKKTQNKSNMKTMFIGLTVKVWCIMSSFLEVKQWI